MYVVYLWDDILPPVWLPLMCVITRPERVVQGTKLHHHCNVYMYDVRVYNFINIFIVDLDTMMLSQSRTTVNKCWFRRDLMPPFQLNVQTDGVCFSIWTDAFDDKIKASHKMFGNMLLILSYLSIKSILFYLWEYFVPKVGSLVTRRIERYSEILWISSFFFFFCWSLIETTIWKGCEHSFNLYRKLCKWIVKWAFSIVIVVRIDVCSSP